MEKSFPHNPVLLSMAYRNGELEIVFRKRKGNSEILEARRYAEVPSAIAYNWFYKSTASETLQYYAKYIRKKFKLLTIKTL